MLPKNSLKDLLHQELSNTDKLLLCLGVDPAKAKAVSEIRSLAQAAGLRVVKHWNISQLLGRSNGLAIRCESGWELTSTGKKHVASIAGPVINSPVSKVAGSLRAHLSKIKSSDTAAFVEEAIACYEAGQYRAAVVLSWVGAISLLQNHVIDTPGILSAFNANAVARFANAKHPWIAAKTTDDLGRMQESDFLMILEKVSVIGKNVKQELETCLKLRNACGHPNSYHLGEHKASAHIEDLILNVYSCF